MSQEIEQNLNKILKSQNCKKNIEAKLTNKKLKAGKETTNEDRVQLNSMLFQFVKDGIITDNVFFYPCVFQLSDEHKVSKEQRSETEVPKAGSFIRTIKMDFDFKNFRLAIYDYQYLGGQGSMVISSAAKVNWNIETISQIVRKNNTFKGGEVLLDSYANDKSVKEAFQFPKVQFMTVRSLEKILAQKEPIELNVEKIRVPKDEDEHDLKAENEPVSSAIKQEF